MEVWILFTLLAALMQSIRTAGQKQLSLVISPMATTLVRYLFGLPFALLYLFWVVSPEEFSVLRLQIVSPHFWVYASLAAVAQIAATFFLVKVMSFRNFAVATLFSKTEAIQTAIFGVIFFSATLSSVGWFAVLLGAAGIVLLSLPAAGLAVEPRSIVYGVLSGFGFAFTALWLREASLSLGAGLIESAALTLCFMVILQSVICALLVWFNERDQWRLIASKIPLAIFVGLTSALGSVGWYTAMTYENAALVRTLGQVEIVVALLISVFFFGEKIALKEFWGMLAIIGSVVTLLLAG